MQVPDFVWETYEAAIEHADRNKLDHLYWAADAVAAAILDMIATGAIPISKMAFEQQVKNMRRNRATTYRRREAIRTAHYEPLHSAAVEPSPEGGVIARTELTRIREQTSPAEWKILCQAADEERYEDIARCNGQTVTAVKKRIVRLRKKLAA